MENLVSRGKKVLSPVLAHYFELEVTEGKGSYLIGKDGKKYLDFATGIAACSTGHCHPRVVAAIVKQAQKLIHACAGIVYYTPNIQLAEKLKKISGLDMSFFCQSGSEAVEGAIKCARYVTGKPGLIAFKGGFHGRSFGALSLTSSNPKYQKGYKPLLPKTYIVEKDLGKLEALIKKIGPDKMAAMIIEPIQGEGGYIVNSKEFLQGLRQICNKNKMFLIFDEVQTGIGRTGKWFAFEHFGVKPDIMTLAKGIASGMPLGVVIGKESIMNAWSTSAHGGTMTGNPVTCAAGIATIETIEAENLLKNAEKMGDLIQKELKKMQETHPVIKDVRGLGLMIGLELPDTETVKKVMDFCLKQGLIIISTGKAGTVIRLVPPLNVKKDQVVFALSIIQKALDSLEK